LIGGGLLLLAPRSKAQNPNLDQQLTNLLAQHNFTGDIESKLEQKLGRKVDNQLSKLGSNLFHDNFLGLNDDNACGGCHTSAFGFGDSQSIAIGIENNGIVGPNRAGPRNQRRAPELMNNAFYPALMLNSRFFSVSGDPFNNSLGFSFPPPEGFTLSGFSHLLIAQAFIPPTEKTEMAGFGPHTNTNNEIRATVVARLNSNSEYRQLFARNFREVHNGGPITYDMLAKAIAEFEFDLTFCDAPIDRFARGQKSAMTDSEKRGAILFFGSLGCVRCHKVSGNSNEQF